MTPEKFLEILSVAAKLRTNTRHCETAPGRMESVADHSWRIALMAMLLSGVEEFRDYDCDKVIRMCLIHDLGEAFTGDIPVFFKTETHEDKEEAVFDNWVAGFPSPQREEWQTLLDEMNALETKEAKLYKALDKVEAVIAHNEVDIKTWLPLEYDYQLEYGHAEMEFSPYMKELRALLDAWTQQKIKEEGQDK